VDQAKRGSLYLSAVERGMVCRHLKARLRHFCCHNSTRRLTQVGESTKCASRHDSFFCAHHDTHFSKHHDTTRALCAQNMCRGCDTTRALTCTKLWRSRDTTGALTCTKLCMGPNQQPQHHRLHKIVNIQYLHRYLCSNDFYSYLIYYYSSPCS